MSSAFMLTKCLSLYLIPVTLILIYSRLFLCIIVIVHSLLVSLYNISLHRNVYPAEVKYIYNCSRESTCLLTYVTDMAVSRFSVPVGGAHINLRLLHSWFDNNMAGPEKGSYCSVPRDWPSIRYQFNLSV